MSGGSAGSPSPGDPGGSWVDCCCVFGGLVELSVVVVVAVCDCC